MNTAPDIIDGLESQQGELADILADSFSTDPVMNWIMPDTSLYPGFFRLLIRDIFLPRGLLHLDRQSRGAGLWLPPEGKFDVPPSLLLLSLVLKLLLKHGPGKLVRIRQQEALFNRHHPKAPHYHLVFVGARHANQGQGVGSALIKQGLRSVDEARMPAYLESSNHKNVPLYERHGFEVIAEDTLPKGGPRVWFMWRDAR